MLHDSTVYDIEVKLKDCLAPSGHSSGGIRRVDAPIERVTISAYCKTIFPKVQAKEGYIPYYFQAFALRCVATFLHFGERSRTR